VALVELLLGKGCQVVIHDRDVARANIIGANREYVEREIPHLWSLMRDTTTEVLAKSDTVVIGNSSKEYQDMREELDGRMVVDLARAIKGRVSDSKYQGICW
jgi:GDP-mannose 6-dehydrogenase